MRDHPIPVCQNDKTVIDARAWIATAHFLGEDTL
ncbi:unnamed protein product, partial [marine sediment metagenome]